MTLKKGLDFKITSNGCFECNSHSYNRYPMFRVNGKRKLMSRHVYEEMFGFIPEGLVVRHKCDNPKCINPEHLELGTMKQNMEDMSKRGRSPRGSKSGRAKMNEEQVKEIKALLQQGMQNKQISKMFGVGETVIINIKYNRTWTHVPWIGDKCVERPVKNKIQGYEIAKQNGVSKKCVWNRVNKNGWSVEKAINTPVIKKHWVLEPVWQEWKGIAMQRGVSKDVFRKRIELDWDYEKAATTPLKRGKAV